MNDDLVVANFLEHQIRIRRHNQARMVGRTRTANYPPNPYFALNTNSFAPAFSSSASDPASGIDFTSIQSGARSR
jgi:hypothetical protein